MSRSQWLLLVVLSVLWGGSFLFVAIAVREVPAFTLVLTRVVIAAAVLVPLVALTGRAMPGTLADWQPFLVMAILNNLIPFTLIAWGQTQIASGLASIINATTPLWSVVLAHLMTADEKIRAHKLAGVMVGVGGVAILVGPDAVAGASASLIGMGAVLAATLSYGFAGIWSRRLRTTPPLVSAASQLTCSSLLLAPFAALVDQPWQLPLPSGEALAALAGLGLLSTALAYIIFFRLIAVSGPTNAMLVTLLIPVSAMALGTLVLGEPILARQIAGALVIAAALLVIDGRLLRWLAGRLRQPA